jgi:hypothetical protein
VAIRYRLQSAGAFGHLAIQDVIAVGAARRIVLERAAGGGTLDSHHIVYEPGLVGNELNSASGKVPSTQ